MAILFFGLVFAITATDLYLNILESEKRKELKLWDGV